MYMVGVFHDGKSALTLVAARLRHVTATKCTLRDVEPPPEANWIRRQLQIVYRALPRQYGIFKEAVISILAAVAKQERVRLSERTIAGLERAKTPGRVGGHPKAEDKDLNWRQDRAAPVTVQKHSSNCRGGGEVSKYRSATIGSSGVTKKHRNLRLLR